MCVIRLFGVTPHKRPRAPQFLRAVPVKRGLRSTNKATNSRIRLFVHFIRGLHGCPLRRDWRDRMRVRRAWTTNLTKGREKHENLPDGHFSCPLRRFRVPSWSNRPPACSVPGHPRMPAFVYALQKPPFRKISDVNAPLGCQNTPFRRHSANKKPHFRPRASYFHSKHTLFAVRTFVHSLP